MKASLSIDAENPENLKRCLEVDGKDSANIKTEFYADENFEVEINANNLSNLRAGINTVLRLVKSCKSSKGR